MVLHGRLCGRVGRRRILTLNPLGSYGQGGFFVPSAHKRRGPTRPHCGTRKVSGTIWNPFRVNLLRYQLRCILLYTLGASASHLHPAQIPPGTGPLSSADGTARATVWESRSSPNFYAKPPWFIRPKGVFLCPLHTSGEVPPVPIAEHGRYPAQSGIRSGSICFVICTDAYCCIPSVPLPRIFTRPRSHPAPDRSPAPMVLHGRLCGRVGRRRIFTLNPLGSYGPRGLFLCFIFKTGRIFITPGQP